MTTALAPSIARPLNKDCAAAKVILTAYDGLHCQGLGDRIVIPFHIREMIGERLSRHMMTAKYRRMSFVLRSLSTMVAQNGDEIARGTTTINRRRSIASKLSTTTQFRRLRPVRSRSAGADYRATATQKRQIINRVSPMYQL
jgi:hypothetical protein